MSETGALQGKVAVVTGGSSGIGAETVKLLAKEGARVVITSNAGCLLQIAREARMQGETLKIVHPMDVLDASYRRAALDLS